MIWWEDFKVGDVSEMGTHTFSEEEIVSFGRQYDPQPFHVDKAAAERGPYGGLIASGWQVCAVGMRLVDETFMNDTESYGSPGIEKVRWLKPVRPGDTVRYRMTVVESRASNSRPKVGLVKHLWEAFNQSDELVLTLEGWAFFGRRPK
ncbi:MAG TPA: MaoC family dehydratase [Burkholderiales bacterium]|nr:MaoC family dehydratase [Burkholderiales bacterium]